LYGKCGSSRTDANQRRQIGWFGSYNCNNGGGDQSLCADPAPRCLYLFCGGHDNFAIQSVRMTIPQRRTVDRAGEAIQWPERTSASIFDRKIANAIADAGAATH
jgi:hypothetical protein